MVLQKEDREFIDKISAVSKHDKTVIMEVMRSLVYCATLEIHKSVEEPDYIPQITIPFIADIKIIYSDTVTSKGLVTDVTLEATPKRALIMEIIDVYEGETTVSEKSIWKQIKAKFNRILEIPS